jgi:hypothetical protein
MIAARTQIQIMAKVQDWKLSALSATWVAALAAAALWIFLILAIHWNSPRTLVSFHGLLHAAIAGQFIGAGPSTIPPENPFYAGEPVAYYWFFQYVAAQITRLFGLNIFYSMEALVLMATGTMMATAVFLGRRIYRTLLAGVLMGYLIVAGTNPLGWVFALYQVLRRGPRILDDNPEHLWGVVHPVYSLIRYNDFGGIYGPLLSFFLNITSRPLALAGLLVMALCLRWSLRSCRLTAFLSLCSVCAVTTALSPIVGITAGGALLASLAASWPLDRVMSKFADVPKLRLKSTIIAGLAIIAGILAAAPTYYQLIFGPSTGHIRFWLISIEGIRNGITVVSSVFLLVVLAIVGLFRAQNDERQFLSMMGISALVLLGLNLLFAFPAGNESNLFHEAVVLLAVPAAGSVVRTNSLGRIQIVSHRLALGIFLVFMPTNLVLLAAYVNRPSLPVSFQTRRIARLPDGSVLSVFYQWVDTRTDPDSIFIVDPKERVAVCGNSLEFPAMTNRAIFTENPDHYIVSPYRDSATRFEIAMRLTSGEKARDNDRVYLTKFNRPIYVVSYRAEDQTLMNRLQDNFGIPVFHDRSVSVYRLHLKTEQAPVLSTSEHSVRRPTS